VNAYSTSQPNVVPYIHDLISSVDFSKATDKSAGNMLKHNMILTTKLPEWIAENKQKYN
jgi:type I restriction enzyme R subunit